MPKIDIDNVPLDRSTGYPPPYNKAVEGRERKRIGRTAGLTQFGVNICTLKPGDAAAWKAGVANGHCLVNRGNRDAKFIEIGTRSATERGHYPDVDMMATRDERGARYTKKDGTSF